MMDAVPSQPGGSHKTPVVLILADTNAALDPSYWTGEHSITHYVNSLFDRVSGSNNLRTPLVGFVTYGLLHANGNPIEVTGFSPLGPQLQLQGIPAGQTIAGDPLGLLALDGYVEALKLIDGFKSGPGQSSENEFSYYLWHIAAGQHHSSETTLCDFSETLWDTRWETLPDKIKERDINFSMILLNPCPKFSRVFYATSPTPIDPWFRAYLHHTILLSGFASSPDQGGKTSPTILVKRPIKDAVEEGYPRRRIRSTHSEPTPVPALILLEEPDQSVGQWSATLIWPRENSPDVCIEVRATNTVHHIDTTTLPKSLRVEVLEGGRQLRDLQAYILKHLKRFSMARIKCACEANACQCKFVASIDSLRKRDSFAIARCDAQGKDSRLSSLLLAPLGEELFCAILPTSDPQDLPKARPAEPLQEEKEPRSDCPPSAETSPAKSGNMECPQGDSVRAQPTALAKPTQDFPQVVEQQQYPIIYPTAFSTETQDLPQMPPQQYRIIQQQHPPPCHFQSPLSHPQDQQWQQYPSSDPPPGLPDGVNAFGEALIDHTYTNTYATYEGQGFYGGDVSEVGTSLVIPGQTNGLETQQLMFQQYPPEPGPGYSTYN